MLKTYHSRDNNTVGVGMCKAHGDILFYNFNSLIWLTGIVEVVSTCSCQPKLITCSKNDNNNYNVPFLHVFNWKSNKEIVKYCQKLRSSQ